MEESARHLPVLLVLLVAVFASAIGAANLTTGDGFNVTFVPSNSGARPAVVAVGGPGGAPSLPAAVRPAALPDDALARAALAALGDDTESYSVVIRRLRDGRGFELNPNREFYAASTFKLAVLYEVERRISTGDLRLDDRLTISGEDAAEDLGTLAALPLAPDGSLTIGDALRAMVTHSDNASAVALLHLVGAANVDATLRRIGAADLSVNTRDLPATAAGMARLTEAIVRGEPPPPGPPPPPPPPPPPQARREGLPAGLPPGATAGNKTGTWEGLTHDIGFVEAPGGTYVIAVLSAHGWVWDPIARISAAAWNELAR
ncbi:MAG TPA: class A beta-lactamase-related serine hydrolase [Tepidiformaceae bacterium]|nr:class A beta-lactamase-related serine hydrolase [Tepidiformaceae bacterium]